MNRVNHGQNGHSTRHDNELCFITNATYTAISQVFGLYANSQEKFQSLLVKTTLSLQAEMKSLVM